MFAIGYALIDLIPVALPRVPVFLALELPDLADMFLVFGLVALYLQLGARASLWRSWKLRAANVAALLILVQGHSIHLAANAIAGASRPSAVGWDLIYFLDEHWGHAELHFAFVILAALFIGWSRPSGETESNSRLSITERIGLYLVTVIYGLSLAADALEGQTVPLMLPAGLALFFWGFWPRLSLGLTGAPQPFSG